MRHYILVFSIILMAFSCKDDNKTKTDSAPNEVIEVEKPKQAKEASVKAGCYMYSEGENKVVMKIIETQPRVKGTLDISYAEKDANSGSFIGEVVGDKLFIDYTYKSEGSESQREMAYLIKDEKLIEGYSDMVDNGTFKDKSVIKYSSTMPLTFTDCSK